MRVLPLLRVLAIEGDVVLWISEMKGGRPQLCCWHQQKTGSRTSGSSQSLKRAKDTQRRQTARLQVPKQATAHDVDLVTCESSYPRD